MTLAGRCVSSSFSISRLGSSSSRSGSARLEAQARQDSRTSSKPPSSIRRRRGAAAGGGAREGQGVDAPRGRAASGRRQSGHRGAGRELRPEDQIDEIVDHYPDACGGCGREFTAEEQRPRRRFGRHQVAELPPISVTWTEHRTHQLRCRHCRARTSARLPEQIGACAFGPRLQAAIVTLTARHRSRAAGSSSSRATCSASRSRPARSTRSASALPSARRPAPAVAGLGADQGSVHVDETGWRTSGEGRRCGPRPPRRGVLPDRRALQPRAVQRADRPLPRDRGL